MSAAPPSGARRLPVGLGSPARAAERGYRCSVASLERGEPLVATASTVSTYLLMEDPGPWGPQILRCLRLPQRLRERAAAWERDLGVRSLLIRRPGRAVPGPRRVYVVDARRGWARTSLVESLAVVADWDLTGLRSPGGAGLASLLEPHANPLLLVCTHGRHDVCCAERGRPVARALAESFGDFVWESSHLGGDRFSPNLLTLPDGHVYGRLDPVRAVDVVAAHLDGRVDLTHHRGRVSVSWPAQYAEQVVRERLRETRRDAVTSRVVARTGEHADVEVTVAAGPERSESRHEIRVAIDAAPPAQLTCRSESPSAAPRYGVCDGGPGACGTA